MRHLHLHLLSFFRAPPPGPTPHLRMGFVNVPLPQFYAVIPNPPFRVRDLSWFWFWFRFWFRLHRVPHAPYLRVGFLTLPLPLPFPRLKSQIRNLKSPPPLLVPRRGARLLRPPV